MCCRLRVQIKPNLRRRVASLMMKISDSVAPTRARCFWGIGAKAQTIKTMTAINATPLIKRCEYSTSVAVCGASGITSPLHKTMRAARRARPGGTHVSSPYNDGNVVDQHTPRIFCKSSHYSKYRSKLLSNIALCKIRKTIYDQTMRRPHRSSSPYFSFCFASNLLRPPISLCADDKNPFKSKPGS